MAPENTNTTQITGSAAGNRTPIESMLAGISLPANHRTIEVPSSPDTTSVQEKPQQAQGGKPEDKPAGQQSQPTTLQPDTSVTTPVKTETLNPNQSQTQQGLELKHVQQEVIRLREEIDWNKQDYQYKLNQEKVKTGVLERQISGLTKELQESKINEGLANKEAKGVGEKLVAAEKKHSEELKDQNEQTTKAEEEVKNLNNILVVAKNKQHNTDQDLNKARAEVTAATADNKRLQEKLNEVEGNLNKAIAAFNAKHPAAQPAIIPHVNLQANDPVSVSRQPQANRNPTWKDMTDMKYVDVNQWLHGGHKVAHEEGRPLRNLPMTTNDIDELKSKYNTYKWGMALCTTVSAVTAVGVAAHFLGMFPGGFASAAALAGVGLAAAAANKYFQSNINNDFDGTVGQECKLALSASTWGERLTRTATLFHMVRDWNRMPFPSQRLVAFSTGKADQLDTLLNYIHRAGIAAEKLASPGPNKNLEGLKDQMFDQPLRDFRADLPRLKSRWGGWPELMLTVSRFSAWTGGIYGVLSVGSLL